MSVPSIPDPLREFLKDLSAIREQRMVSLEEIRAATKVHLHIISQFEQDGLVDHPLFNELYLRAFVRGYAKTIGISQDQVAGCYEQAVSGLYRRELAVSHLGLPPQQESEPEPEPASVEEPVIHHEEPEIEPVKPQSRVTWVAADSGEKKPDLVQIVRGLIASILSRESAFIQWGIVAIGGGIGLLLILQLLSLQQSSEDISPPAVEETPPPSTIVDQRPSATSEDMEAINQQPLVLKDSLDVYVVASTGKLDPFRIRVDEDLRRPYWLDAGDSMRFRMGERIIVEDNLAAMRILLEGHVYPIRDTDSSATVVITRDTARAFLTIRN